MFTPMLESLYSVRILYRPRKIVHVPSNYTGCIQNCDFYRLESCAAGSLVCVHQVVIKPRKFKTFYSEKKSTYL